MSRHADVVLALKSRDLAQLDIGGDLRRLTARMGGGLERLIALVEGAHPFQNPPAHDAARAGARAAVAEMLSLWTWERITAWVDERLDELPTGETIDAAQLLADGLPAAVAAATIGLDAGELKRLSPHARAITTVWEKPYRPIRELREIDASAALLIDALQQAGPSRGDAGRVGDPALAVFLMTAGVEASAGVIGSALDVLAQDPALQGRLRAQPETIAAFVEEVLRYHPPLRRMAARRCRAEVELGGVRLRAGDWVVADLERAQRDAAVYPEPDRFDAQRYDGSRRSAPVIAFGAGPHACVGSVLGRLEARAAVSALLARFKLSRGGAAPHLRPSREWRQYDSLPVVLEPLPG